MSKVKIVTFVPLESADEVRQVLGEAGTGILGEYTFCSYSVVGKGRFLSSQNANPHIGEPGKFEVVEEERIEVTCNKDKAKHAVQAMKSAHPCEGVAFDIYPLLEENEL